MISALPLEEILRNRKKNTPGKISKWTITKICLTGLCYLFFRLYNVPIFANYLFSHNAFSFLYGCGEIWNKNDGILFLILQYKSPVKNLDLVYIRIMNILTPIYKLSFRNMGAFYFLEPYFTHCYDLNEEWRLYISPLIWHDDFISPRRVNILQYDYLPFQVI